MDRPWGPSFDLAEMFWLAVNFEEPYVKPASVQGYLAHKKQPPPQDNHRDLGIVLL